jgi:RNA polymerase primary sigma factor
MGIEPITDKRKRTDETRTPGGSMSTTKTRNATGTSDSLGLLLRDLDRHPMPDHEGQVALARRVAAGDDEARREMVAANLRLVVHWARRYQDRGVDMADLVQEGTFGLLRAVEKFDWERGFRFSTYATWWIRQALQRAVQQHGRTIRIPLEVGERLQRLDAVTAELAGQLGRPPTEDELTEATGLSIEERRSLEDVARVAASLDQPASADSATSLGDLVAPDNEDWVGGVDQEMVFDRVREAVERLPGLQRDVLRLRFGFDGDSPASLQVTAERLGIGVRRVRRAEEEALAALSADVDVVGAHLAA